MEHIGSNLEQGLQKAEKATTNGGYIWQLMRLTDKIVEAWIWNISGRRSLSNVKIGRDSPICIRETEDTIINKWMPHNKCFFVFRYVDAKIS